VKGRPILGIISGFLFGLFGGITLFLYGAIPLASPMLWILPLVGIVLGMFIAAWAPFGGGGTNTGTATTETVSYAGAGDADGSETIGSTLEGKTIEVELKPADDETDGSES